MHTGQMLLVLGALVIFSMLALSMNSSILTSTETSIETESIRTATDVAQSMTSEITSKEFDLAVTNGTLDDIMDLTAPYSLGPAWNESYPNYNDVDDFDDFSKTVTTPRLGDFTINVEVKYVPRNNPDQVVYYRTKMKRIKVVVNGPSLENPVTVYSWKCY